MIDFKNNYYLLAPPKLQTGRCLHEDMDLKLLCLFLFFCSIETGLGEGPKLTHPAFTSAAEMTLKVVYW